MTGGAAASRVSVLVTCRVDLLEVLPLVVDRLFREDRGPRARGLAVAALDTDVRIDVEHLGRLELFLVLARMDAIDRTHVHAGRVLRADAGLRDDVHAHQGSSSVEPGFYRESSSFARR